jgi:uncharacterized membrane protein
MTIHFSFINGKKRPFKIVKFSGFFSFLWKYFTKFQKFTQNFWKKMVISFVHNGWILVHFYFISPYLSIYADQRLDLHTCH